MLGLATWFLVFARHGFNPTDDGFVLAQSWRILQGEVPHADFVSPRPLGSAVLHVLDVLPPWPTLLWSRLLVTLQMAWITFALLDIGVPRIPKRFTLVGALFPLAFVTNWNTFPLMAWHAIDGVFVGALGLWFVIRGPRRFSVEKSVIIGLTICGCSPLMKQGFLIIPAVGILLAVNRLTRRRLLISMTALIGPAVFAVYLLAVAGLNSLLQTLRGAPGPTPFPPKGQGLLPFVAPALEALISRPAALLCAVALLAALMSRSSQFWLRFASIALATVSFIILMWQSKFVYDGNWTYLVVASMWIIGGLGRSLRMVWPAYVAITALAIGAATSWGVPYPAIVAGSALALCFASLAMTPSVMAEREIGVGVLTLIIVLSCAIAICGSFWRSRLLYQQGTLSSASTAVDLPALRQVSVTSGTAVYLQEAERCIRLYPARKVSVVPDSAGLAPLLRFHQAFSLDWWWVWERTPAAESALRADVDRLNTEGNFLVLQQTYPLIGRTLADQVGVRRGAWREVAGEYYWQESRSRLLHGSGAPSYYLPSDGELLKHLDGKRIRCGPFIGIWNVR